MPKQYDERSPMQLDEAGGYFCRHVAAMTAEGLHGKAEIAEELAYRDMVIDQLKSGLHEALTELEASGYCFDHPQLARLRRIIPA